MANDEMDRRGLLVAGAGGFLTLLGLGGKAKAQVVLDREPPNGTMGPRRQYGTEVRVRSLPQCGGNSGTVSMGTGRTADGGVDGPIGQRRYVCDGTGARGRIRREAPGKRYDR